MASSSPKVSICVPIYNNASVIATTLDTLVNQQGVDYELVLVDNNSSDGTRAILDDYARRYPKLIRLVYKKKTTVASINWNDALAAARGKYVALYHGDDLYAPAMAARQAAFIDSHPQALAVFTETQVVDNQLRPRGFIRAPYSLSQEMFTLRDVVRPLAMDGLNFLVCPTFMARRAKLGSKPYFTNKLWFAFDIDYYLRLLKRGPVGIIRENLHRYRRTTAAASVMLFTRQTEQNEIYPILRPYLAAHSNWFSPSERAQVQAREAADWWPIAVNAQGAGQPERAAKIWNEHFSYSLLLSATRYPALWSKSIMAFGFDLSRRLHLANPWANFVLRYRVFKQTGRWQSPPPRRAN